MFIRCSEFLGANVLDEQPFIVMPYLANGNARDCLITHPECDRLKIVCSLNKIDRLLAESSFLAAWYIIGTRAPFFLNHHLTSMGSN